MSGKAGRSGRRPKPTSILKLTGAFRRDRHGARANEPKPAKTKVTCPSWLKGDARRVWTSLAPELSRLGLLTALDVPVFTMFCVEYGSYLVAAKDPDAKASDRLKHLAAAKDLGGLFGLDPSSRTRLRVNPSDEPDLQTLLDSVVKAEKERRA